MITRSDGRIIIELELAEDEFNRNLTQAEGNTRSFGNTLKNLLATFGLMKAGAAVFGMIKDSIGAAMTRLDTMSQFERVMTTMTGSAKKANDALANIKNTVTGTAYGLDIAASSTQKFVTSGMDISKATEQVKIWGDAVAFYGKGTNESYANVTDALAKMTAKGKVEMDQLNRLTDEGIPAVQIFADYTGKSMQEVQNALSNGSISSQEFMDTLQNAMANGTAKFASIEGAAKKAGTSWTGTIDNMKAAVTRGMTQIIDSIDKGMKKANLGSLKDNIASFGKNIESVLGKLGAQLPRIIKLLSDMKGPIVGIGTAYAATKLLPEIKDTYSSVKTLKKGFSEVFNLMKKDKSVSGISEALGLVAGAGDNSSKSLKKLGGMMDDLPTLALTIGLGSLVAGFISLKDYVDSTPMGKLSKDIDEATKSIKEMQDATDKQIADAEAEFNYYDSLKTELEDIVDENGKVKDGYKDRAQFIMNELNKAYGTEMTMIDGVIQGYQDQMRNLDDLMAKQKAQSLIDAYSDDYDKAIKKRNDYNKDFGELEKQRLKEEDFIQKEIKKLKKQGYSDAEALSMAEYRAGEKGLAAWKGKYDDARQNMVKNNTLIDKIEKARIALSQGNYAEVENILSEHNYNMSNLNKQSVDELNTNIGEAEALREAALTMYAETGDEKYQRMAEQYDADIVQMQAALDAQRGVLSENSEGYKTAWKDYMDAGLAGAYGKAKSFNEVGQLLIGELANGVTQKEIDGVGSVQRVGDKMLLTANGMDYLFNSSGQLIGSSLTLGVEAGFSACESKIYTKTGTISKKAIQEYAKGDWKGTGEKATYEIAKGTEINGEKIKTQMRITADGTVQVWDKKKKKFQDAGKAVCDGTKLGIDLGSGAVVTSFGNVAVNALNTFKKVFNVKSPSKVMKTVGKYIMQGLGIGIDSNAKIALSAMTSTAQNMITLVKKELSNIKKINPNFDFVAKVKTDYSSAKLQSDQLRSSIILGGGATTHKQETVKEYNTNVSITSPKPLSESEISEEIEKVFGRLEWRV